MNRPLADIRPVGPVLLFNQRRSDAVPHDARVDYTILFSSPGIPSTEGAPASVVKSFVARAGTITRNVFDIEKSQHQIFTEYIVAMGMRDDGAMLVIKLFDVSINDEEVVEGAREVLDKMDGTFILDKDKTDMKVYRGDFFNVGELIESDT